jgi:predicted ATPase
VAPPASSRRPWRRVVSSSVGPRPYGLAAGLFVEGYGIGPADSLESARAKVEHGMRAIDAGDAEIELVVPVVGYILGLQSVERSSEIEPERLKRQIAMTLRTVLERRLAKGPLVLVLEDLQWADAASIEAIPTLADWLCVRPLLVVLTGRPPFDPAPSTAARVTHSALRLEPLADRAIESLLAAFFGAGAESPFEHALQERIVRQAGGNPLYLEEVVRSLISNGILTRGGDGRWRCDAAAGNVEVPSSIEGLLLSRMDRLPRAARRTLQSAAILGPLFESTLLGAVDEAAADPALLALLCDAELLVPVAVAAPAAPRYRFASTMAHDVAYQNLLLRRRTELHQRAGTVLEGVHGIQPARLEDLEALGHHFQPRRRP